MDFEAKLKKLRELSNKVATHINRKNLIQTAIKEILENIANSGDVDIDDDDFTMLNYYVWTSFSFDIFYIPKTQKEFKKDLKDMGLIGEEE